MSEYLQGPLTAEEQAFLEKLPEYNQQFNLSIRSPGYVDDSESESKPSHITFQEKNGPTVVEYVITDPDHVDKRTISDRGIVVSHSYSNGETIFETSYIQKLDGHSTRLEMSETHISRDTEGKVTTDTRPTVFATYAEGGLETFGFIVYGKDGKSKPWSMVMANPIDPCSDRETTDFTAVNYRNRDHSGLAEITYKLKDNLVVVVATDSHNGEIRELRMPKYINPDMFLSVMTDPDDGWTNPAVHPDLEFTHLTFAQNNAVPGLEPTVETP